MASEEKFSNYLASLDKMREFMFTDIQNGINAKTNFMLALALSVYTEIWGRLLKGISRGSSQVCYESFLCRMGGKYKQLLDGGVPVYRDIRCGLVHSYAIERTACVKNEMGDCGITYSNGRYCFNIQTYFYDFKQAVDQYVSDLKTSKQLKENLRHAMKKKPLMV